jgi:hypothetical protein
LLIIFAVAGLIYWETDGRDRILTEKILVSSEGILEGTVITAQMFHSVSAMPETIVEGAIRPEEADKIQGKEAAMDIPKNQQMSEALLREPGEKEIEKLSPYLIKTEWIDSRSSSLRQGDHISVYSRDGSLHLGDFEVLFVKDVNDREITDAVSNEAGHGRQNGEKDIRDRAHSSGVIDHLEILTDLDGYGNILRHIDTEDEGLLIVQKGDNT